MSINIKKLSLILLSIVPNAYLIKSMLVGLPDLTLMLYVCLYGLLFVSIIKNRENIPKLTSIHDIFIYLWVIIGFCSLFYSPYMNVGLFKILKFCFLGLGITYLIRFHVRSKNDWDYLIKSYIFTAFVIQLLVIYTYLQAGMPYGRFNFYDAHPIPLGMLGSITAVLMITQLLSKKVPIHKFIIIFSSSLWVMFISSSKGPFLAMGLGLILLLPTIINSFKRGILFFILGSIIFFFVSKTEQYQMMVYRLLYTSKDQSTYDRLNLYNLALDEFYKSPIFGRGFGVFNDFYPHNVFLEILAEGGLLLGGIFVLFILWTALKYLMYLVKFRNDSYYYEPLIIIIMSIFVLMVSFTYVDLKFLYFGLGGVLVFNRIKNTVTVPEMEKKKKKRLLKKIPYCLVNYWTILRNKMTLFIKK